MKALAVGIEDALTKNYVSIGGGECVEICRMLTSIEARGVFIRNIMRAASHVCQHAYFMYCWYQSNFGCAPNLTGRGVAGND